MEQENDTQGSSITLSYSQTIKRQFQKLPKELQHLTLLILFSAWIALFFGAMVGYALIAGYLGSRITCWCIRADKKTTDEPN